MGDGNQAPGKGCGGRAKRAPQGAAPLAGRQVPSNGSWDTGAESKAAAQQSNSPTEGGGDGRPVSWLPVLKQILLLFWLLKTNPVTE